MNRITWGVALGLVGLAAADAAATEPADLVITNGLVVTENAARDVIERGVVVIRAERIVAVGPAETASRYQAAKVIDARGGIVMPGLINTHTHAAMSVFRGLGDDVADRLRRFIWPLEAKVVDADLVYWGSLHSMVEMIEGGTTTLVDSYPFPEATAKAADEIGIRAVIPFAVKDDLPAARAFVAAWRGHPRITAGLSLHSPYGATADQIRAGAALSAELGVPITMHVAEMDFELSELRKKYNQTPIV